ncbi:MAG: DUF86 domain-containing protein [Athalassotoga sp.]|uniref:HepT-like ribonuclease domain-containing protein n=1 Tax=Athalassotoga sp. TaxID=2022597 RepID=UPI003D010960
MIDIVESIRYIKRYTLNLNEEEFYQSEQIQDAVLRRLEIIGEATKNISDDFKDQFPQLPWKEMAGIRDVIIHDYFGINLRRIWLTVKQDLPTLETLIEEVLKKI